MDVVAFARDAGEEEAIERVLDACGVAYDIRLDALPDVEQHGACLLVRLYTVDAADAPRVRKELVRRGLGDLVSAQPGQ